MAAKADREARLKAALRANLTKRKARDRAAGEPEREDGPAAQIEPPAAQGPAAGGAQTASPQAQKAEA